MRPIRHAVALLLCAAVPAGAQLRPLDPLPWRVLEEGTTLTAELGGAVLSGQRASLAGTEGRLTELGNFQLAWRSGRIALELAGTGLRLFRDERAFAAPYGGTLAGAGPERSDAGDIRIATLVHLTPGHSRTPVALRFGTRLPTTDNEEGLDRDRTDFFALLGTGLRTGALRLGAEAGVGIHGSHEPNLEQADVLLYSATAEYLRLGPVVPTLAWTGQRNGTRGWRPRGNEDLSELRIGLRTRGRLGVEAAWVRGLTDFSPAGGVRLGVSLTR